MKKNENLDSKLQILTPNQEIFKNSRKFSFFLFFFIFFFFFHFPCPWHLKSRKAMKNNEKQWKTHQNKGKWKKNEVANEKKNENLDSATSFFFHFPLFLMVFHCFSLFFMAFLDFRCHGQGKWKNNEKKLKKNENFLEFLKISWFGVRICNFESKFSFFIFLCFWWFSIVFHCFSWLSWISGAMGKENEKKMIKKLKEWKFPRVFEDFLVRSENLQLWVQIFIFFSFKVADSHSEPGNLQKLEEIFIFSFCFSFFPESACEGFFVKKQPLY